MCLIQCHLLASAIAAGDTAIRLRRTAQQVEVTSFAIQPAVRNASSHCSAAIELVIASKHVISN